MNKDSKGGSSNNVPSPGQSAVSVEVARPQTWTQIQLNGLRDIFIHPVSVLLVFVPLGIVSGVLEWGSLPTFGFNFLAIIPLAAVLGGATESLAAHTGQMVGGLLNATFGNAVEMIVTINAIRSPTGNLVPMVQQSLIGSILSNLLLVLGMAFLAAGCREKTSFFNKEGAGANISCLVLSSLALTLPTVFAYMNGTTVEDEVMLSRIIAAVMACVYAAFLVFQLKTHANLFSAEEAEKEEEEEKPMSVYLAAAVLLAATVAVSYCSDYLVDNIKEVSNEHGVPYSFIGLILLPIVGNAAEHTTAVSAAYKGMMDLALGVAVGSSTQIALFVVPFSVIVGWVSDVNMTLNFECFDAAVFLLSVFIASGILSDGNANWFEGLMLCSTYFIVAIISWFIPTEGAEGRLLSDATAGWFSAAPAGSGGAVFA